MNKVYISGKISGLSEKVYKNNFNSAELYLTGLGYDAVNPISDGLIPNGTWEDYMRRDIKLLCDCDYIYLIEPRSKPIERCYAVEYLAHATKAGDAAHIFALCNLAVAIGVALGYVFRIVAINPCDNCVNLSHILFWAVK